MPSPGTALDSLNEEMSNFDLTSFGGPLQGDLFESPMPSPGQAPFPFNHNHNPFTSPPEALVPPRTASPLVLNDPNSSHMDPFGRSAQSSPTRHPFRSSILSTPDLSPTHNPLRDSLLQARQPSPIRDSFTESFVRTPEPSPTRNSFSHPNPMYTAPDLRPTPDTPRSSRSPNRSRQSPSPTRRIRAHQRTQSLASINSVMSLADGDMEQYRVESNVRPEQISELIGETEAPTSGASADAVAVAPGGGAPSAPESNKRFICKWIEANKDSGEEKPCGQFFERKENCKAHIQTHLDDRQYKCPYGFCGKLFVRSHDLRRHLRTHDVHKKWVCPCGRDFSRADALHRHQGRGNCIGAPPGTKRKEPAKRGRPPKKKDNAAEDGGDTNNSAGHNNNDDSRGSPPLPNSLPPSDLLGPPQPNDNDDAAGGTSASFAPMGGYHHHHQASPHEEKLPPHLHHHHLHHHHMDEDMTGMPDFVGTDPSPSPVHIHDAGVALAPSPLEEELSSSPMPPPGDHDDLLEATGGDEWLEDLIFINDENFVDTGPVSV